jgi:hypothetical protein
VRKKNRLRSIGLLGSVSVDPEKLSNLSENLSWNPWFVWKFLMMTLWTN